MNSQSSKKRTFIFAVVALIILGIVLWFVFGRNKIISAVPESEGESTRVILVTPRATPTSEYEPTPTLTEEEQAKADEEAETEEEEDPTPTDIVEEDPTPTEDPTDIPEPTPEE